LIGRLLKSISIRRPAKSSYQDLPEEERQKIKDLLFILEKN
jgi:mRNA-degrading endonuclease RelE of RelBE toxin-antitoxin system